jgi:hypothetical protein
MHRYFEIDVALVRESFRRDRPLGDLTGRWLPQRAWGWNTAFARQAARDVRRKSDAPRRGGISAASASEKRSTLNCDEALPILPKPPRDLATSRMALT